KRNMSGDSACVVNIVLVRQFGIYGWLFSHLYFSLGLSFVWEDLLNVNAGQKLCKGGLADGDNSYYCPNWHYHIILSRWRIYRFYYRDHYTGEYYRVGYIMACTLL